jgi:nucleoside-diphosphate-sugar epimerase
MPGRAVVIGGCGFIGAPISRALVAGGWRVDVVSRATPGPEGTRHVPADRKDPEALRAAVGDDADVLVDVIPLDPEDGEQLVALSPGVGSIVAISSAAVYTDARGRAILAGPDDPAPALPIPISESQPTAAPGSDGYAARKASIEASLRESASVPVTILRPSAVFGAGDTASREWWVVKRILDGRVRIVTTSSRFHQTDVELVADLVRRAADNPGNRVLNAADAESRPVPEIAEAVASALGHAWREVRVLDRPDPESGAGASPWAASVPIVLDTAAAAEQLGATEVRSHAEAVESACRWLVDSVSGCDWREVLPRSAQHYGELFDYEAEDRLLDAEGP